MMNTPPVRIQLYGLGEIISFKNKKRAILDRQSGKLRTMTSAKAQAWMERCVQAIESQLRSELQTRGIATTTGRSQLCSIASFMPLDDSRHWIPELTVKSLPVSRGKEGAEILIERIT